jgi:hypothetical protein
LGDIISFPGKIPRPGFFGALLIRRHQEGVAVEALHRYGDLEVVKTECGAKHNVKRLFVDLGMELQVVANRRFQRRR